MRAIRIEGMIESIPAPGVGANGELAELLRERSSYIILSVHNRAIAVRDLRFGARAEVRSILLSSLLSSRIFLPPYAEIGAAAPTAPLSRLTASWTRAIQLAGATPHLSHAKQRHPR